MMMIVVVVGVVVVVHVVVVVVGGGGGGVVVVVWTSRLAIVRIAHSLSLYTIVVVVRTVDVVTVDMDVVVVRVAMGTNWVTDDARVVVVWTVVRICVDRSTTQSGAWTGVATNRK
jgi:hypothetical protein